MAEFFPSHYLVRTRDLPDVVSASRTNPDGITTGWEPSAPVHDPHLPFLMGPYDPPQDPTPEQVAHANGIAAIVGIRVSQPAPSKFGGRLATLLGIATVEAHGDGVAVHSMP